MRAQRTRERENEKTILNYTKGEKYVGKKKKNKKRTNARKTKILLPRKEI